MSGARELRARFVRLALIALLLLVAPAITPAPGGFTPSPKLPIGPGDSWTYFSGIIPPDPSWNTVSFHPFGWRSGRLPSGSFAVYARRTFELRDARSAPALRLTVVSARGFVAYINGVEVARTASGGRYEVALQGAPVVSGVNVLAIEAIPGDRSLSPTLELLDASVEPPSITNVSPDSGAIDVSWAPRLCVDIADPDSDVAAMTVTFRGGDSGAPLGDLGTAAPIDGRACITWAGRQPTTTYAWQASTSDGFNDAVGSQAGFTTAATCTLDAECDDGNECSTDTCVSGSCAHDPIDGGTTFCGQGVCANSVKTCIQGVLQTCVPGNPFTTVDSSCNNSDDDCDGAVDDDYVTTPTTCGSGACHSTGIVTCQAGHEVDSCQPGPPLASTDVTCDLVDDDCDGAVDDDIVRTVTTCGVGICASEGNRSCESGVWVDTCVPRPPILPSDTNCNNIDSDCDGQIDEDYVPVPTTCGSGACQRTGLVTCQAGHEVDSCVPGPPLASTDVTCDLVDDDCDGAVDDDIVRTVTTCGVGFCASEGNRSCESGVWVDTCVPRSPIGPTDSSCNNSDDDCDGVVDDDYVQVPTTCGSGACQRTGIGTCQVGHEVDTCVPGSPTVEICNGIDDDCDGVIDNGGHSLCDDGDECNGSETCGGLSGCLAGEPFDAQVEVRIPRDLVATPGGTILVPILAEPAAGIEIDVSLSFDSTVLQAVGVTTTAITQGANLTFDLSNPGEVAARVATTEPGAVFVGTGSIVMVEFQVVGPIVSTTTLNLTRAVVDEGAISTCEADGRLRTCATLPAEVGGLSLAGAATTSLAWTADPAAATYDLVSGLLSAMRSDRSVFSASCLATGLPGPAALDSRSAPPGDGFYYLVRGHAACGAGSFGAGSAGETRSPSAACP